MTHFMNNFLWNNFIWQSIGGNNGFSLPGNPKYKIHFININVLVNNPYGIRRNVWQKKNSIILLPHLIESIFWQSQESSIFYSYMKIFP